jgi:hypothetical protein
MFLGGGDRFVGDRFMGDVLMEYGFKLMGWREGR